MLDRLAQPASSTGPEVFVVTGATSGIGEALATNLLRAGKQVVLVGRSRERLQATLGRLPSGAGTPPVSTLLADLSSLEETARLASEVRSSFPQLRGLVNNAGLASSSRQVSVDGHEKVLATNVLAPFLLTELLQPSLGASGSGRVVNVASVAHQSGRIDWSDMELERGYTAWRSYTRSKLLLLLITLEAARRHGGRSPTFNACHPGFVRTRISAGLTGGQGVLYRLGERLFAVGPQKGAETPTYLALSSEVNGVSGKYFVRERETLPSEAAQDLDLARRAWSFCEGATRRWRG